MIFDHKTIVENKNKVAKNFSNYDFLIKEVSFRLADRLDIIKRSFENALILGCFQGASSDCFIESEKIKNFICLDDAKLMLKQEPNYILKEDENYLKDIESQSQDIVISSMFLQNVNDIKSLFANVYRVLKKDSAFLFTVPGLGTLKELEEALVKIDLDTQNAFVSRVHPFLELKETANLMQDIGFKDISSDKDTIEIMYKDAQSLFQDLKGMGARSVIKNNFPLTKNSYKRLVNELESQKEAENNHFKITIELCNFIAWK